MRGFFALALLCAGVRASAAPALSSLQNADSAGARALQNADRGDLAGAAALSETGFDELYQMKAGGAPAVQAGAPGSYGRGLSAPLTVSAARAHGAEGVGTVSAAQEPPAPKGWEGFKKGFSDGFSWAETPSRDILEGSVECGNLVCVPSRSAVWRGPGSLLVGILLAVPAAIVGLFTGLKGAIFGA